MHFCCTFLWIPACRFCCCLRTQNSHLTPTRLSLHYALPAPPLFTGNRGAGSLGDGLLPASLGLPLPHCHLALYFLPLFCKFFCLPLPACTETADTMPAIMHLQQPFSAGISSLPHRRTAGLFPACRTFLACLHALYLPALRAAGPPATSATWTTCLLRTASAPLPPASTATSGTGYTCLPIPWYCHHPACPLYLPGLEYWMHTLGFSSLNHACIGVTPQGHLPGHLFSAA